MSSYFVLSNVSASEGDHDIAIIKASSIDVIDMESKIKNAICSYYNTINVIVTRDSIDNRAFEVEYNFDGDKTSDRFFLDELPIF